uniref:Uncharacterized protein n=1 Tax=Romanomermis culicivorax TaxID=13658 RepID=A0A915HJH3_ROMCU
MGARSRLYIIVISVCLTVNLTTEQLVSTIRHPRPKYLEHDFLCNSGSPYACVCYVADASLAAYPGCRILLGADRLPVVKLTVQLPPLTLASRDGVLQGFFQPAVIATLITRWCMNATQRCLGTTLPVKDGNVVALKLDFRKSLKAKSSGHRRKKMIEATIYYTVVKNRQSLLLTADNILETELILRVMRKALYRNPNLFGSATVLDHGEETLDSNGLVHFGHHRNNVVGGGSSTPPSLSHYMKDNIGFFIMIAGIIVIFTAVYVIAAIKVYRQRQKHIKHRQDLAKCELDAHTRNNGNLSNYGTLNNRSPVPSTGLGQYSPQICNYSPALSNKISIVTVPSQISKKSSRVTIDYPSAQASCNMRTTDDMQGPSTTASCEYGPLRVADTDAYEVEEMLYIFPPIEMSQKVDKTKTTSMLRDFFFEKPNKILRSLSMQFNRKMHPAPVANITLASKSPLMKATTITSYAINYKHVDQSESNRCATPPQSSIMVENSPAVVTNGECKFHDDIPQCSIGVDNTPCDNTPTATHTLAMSTTEEYLLQSSDLEERDGAESRASVSSLSSVSSATKSEHDNDDFLNPHMAYQPLTNSAWSINQTSSPARSMDLNDNRMTTTLMEFSHPETNNFFD